MAKMILIVLIAVIGGCGDSGINEKRMYLTYMREMEADLRLLRAAYEEMGQRVDQLMADSARYRDCEDREEEVHREYRSIIDEMGRSIQLLTKPDSVRCRWYYANIRIVGDTVYYHPPSINYWSVSSRTVRDSIYICPEE